MDLLDHARNLGVELQKDERFVEYAKAKLALDRDEALQKLIGDFNLTRMNLEQQSDAEKADETKKAEQSARMREIYNQIMENETMKAYNDAKIVVDQMIRDIQAILSASAEGLDPLTYEIPKACSGSCATCGGCH